MASNTLQRCTSKLRLLLPFSTTSGNSNRPISYLQFPVHSTNGRGPNTIFCQGLGASWTQPFVLELQAEFERLGRRFTRFQYRFLGESVQEPQPIWNVDTWVEDIVTLIDRFYETSGPLNLLAISAGAQAALRAAIAREYKVHKLGLISPGVALDLGYMERVLPGSRKRLERGEIVQHPAYKGGDQVYVAYDELMVFGRKCPVNAPGPVPLERVPVHVVHGIDDKIVPYANSVQLASKLPAGKCHLVLANKQGHLYKHVTPEIKRMIADLVDEDTQDSVDGIEEQLLAHPVPNTKVHEWQQVRV